MPILYSDSVIAYNRVVVPLSDTRGSPYVIFVGAPTVPLNSIRLWGVVRFFRLRATPLGGRDTLFLEKALRARTERLEIPFPAQVGVLDNIQVITTYEFDTLEIYDNL